jgi:16S rRNA (adenine1518-N6/adenine1519-N6)-dimethyltransferase
VDCEKSVKIRGEPPASVPYPVKLSEIASTLREINVRPIKTLGQNFLHDQNLARWIVAQAALSADDFVLEIGPGLGALTEQILASGARALVIEKDARLAKFLRAKFPTERLEVIHGDALEFDLRRLFPEGPAKVIGNLPYYISTELLLRFLEKPIAILFGLFMLQREVATRLSAIPGTHDYGVLSLITQAQARVEYLKTVPASVFLPEPQVDSAFVRVTPRSSGELAEYDWETFAQLVRAGFSQRRKQVGKLLAQQVEDWPAAAESIGVDPRARAENLALSHWIALANRVHPSEDGSETAAPTERFPLVDAEDRVIGDAARAEVHANNLRHRAVHIFLFNKAGELFLQKRSARKDRHPLVWDSSAAGHVDVGESYEESAARELREELGVAADLQPVAKLSASDLTGQEFIWLYRGTHEGPFRLARSEIESGAFFPLALITDWITRRPHDFAPGFLECWRVFNRAAG